MRGKIYSRHLASVSKLPVRPVAAFSTLPNTSGGEEAGGTYLAVENLNDLRPSLEQSLADYNRSNPGMSLVMFDEAIVHTLRLSRILSRPGGHALLVGIGGSGEMGNFEFSLNLISCYADTQKDEM